MLPDRRLQAAEWKAYPHVTAAWMRRSVRRFYQLVDGIQEAPKAC